MKSSRSDARELRGDGEPAALLSSTRLLGKSLRPGAQPAVAAILLVSAASWYVAVRQMEGMDMGVATELESFPFSWRRGCR